MLPGLRAAVADSRAKAAATRARKAAAVEPAAVDPVAQVLVDLPLAHLDRPFDYLVPAQHADQAVPGTRVKVRFAGQDVDGFVLARTAESEHPGRLAPLRRVVSAEPVLAPEVAELAGAVAERYAGSRADVLRLAVPPRHATTEQQPSAPRDPPVTADPDAGAAAWAGHDPAAAYLSHLADGGSPRAVWAAAPGTDWPAALAQAAAHTLASGRGALLVVPDHRDVTRVDAALTQALGEGHHVTLTAEAGPAARYRDFLCRLARPPSGRPRHPRRGVRAGPRPRAGGDLGRRRRPPRRAARALPPRPRSAAAACRAAADRSARGRVRAHRRGPAAAGHRLGPRDRGAARRAARAPHGHDRRVGGTRAWRPAARTRRTTCCEPCWPATRCWCRPRGPATRRASRASAAGPPPAAAAAPARWSSPVRPTRHAAAGVATRPPAGPAPSAAIAGCGRRSSARAGPPRSSAARSRGSRC